MKRFDYLKLKDLRQNKNLENLIKEIDSLNLNLKKMKLNKNLVSKLSSVSSHAIEGLIANDYCITKFYEGIKEFDDRTILEIINYANILDNIDSYHIKDANSILNIHKDLFKDIDNPLGGKIKTSQNYISEYFPDGHIETLFTPVKPENTLDALEAICKEYIKAKDLVHPLILIPTFINDYLCIHPFCSGNGRTSRLLTDILLNDAGYQIFKYKALDELINKNKSLYFDTLRASQKGWYQDKENVFEFIKFMLSIILEGYKEVL